MVLLLYQIKKCIGFTRSRASNYLYLYGWSRIFGQLGICFSMFSFVTLSYLIILVLFHCFVTSRFLNLAYMKRYIKYDFLLMNQIFNNFFVIEFNQKILDVTKYKFLMALIFHKQKNLNFLFSQILIIQILDIENIERLREFIFKNYYNRIGFAKEDSCYSLKKRK